MNLSDLSIFTVHVDGPVMAPSKAYVTSVVPLKGRSEVIVTDASLGPSKFFIRLKNSNWEYQRMCSELESTPLHSLPVTPDKGTPCIAVKSEKLHRGLVLSTDRDQNTSNICLVDFGCIEALPHNMLFQIPDGIMAYRLFSTSVALTNGEALSQKPGMNEIFASLVPSLGYLTCEVVKVEATRHTVNLYDVNKQNIAKLVLSMYNNMVPKVKALSPAPPPILNIKIPDPKLLSAEKLFVTVSHRVGHFYGQLVNRPTSELTDIFSELHNFYKANQKAARLDVGSSIGRIAVVKWSQDGQFYRCRILNVTGNFVEIQFVDFGDVMAVPRRDIFAPVVSGHFVQPAFGINCVLSHDGTAFMKKKDWDAALLEKTVEVRIVNKNPDGTYTVAFTIDPFNHKVLERLYPLTNPVALQIETAQLEPKRSTIQSPSTDSKAKLGPKRSTIQSPSRVAIGILTESDSLNKPRADFYPKKSPPRQIFQKENIGTSVPIKDPFLQRLLASPVVQEILRTTCELPSAASESKQGIIRSKPTSPKTTSSSAVQMMDRTASLIPTIPVPTGTYAFLDTARQSVAVAWFYSFDRFFLKPMDVTTYEAKLEPLNGFYASLSANELVEDSPKVGLPCVVRFKEDGKFYRSQILTILSDKTAQVLFVDYGNEQITPLTDIKRIVPKFMKLPQLIWPCKLAGIDGSQLRTDVTLSADDELIATFLSIDKGVHLVKVVHKTHGDIATYITKKSPVLRPAVSQLPDPEHPLRPDGHNVFVSYVKSASEFWIQFKANEQIIIDLGEELAQHVEKGASRVERPIVGQLYAMERPIFGGYFRARVSSCDGKMVQATFVDYGDDHPVSTEKVFPLPDRLGALPPLATRCTISRPKWSLEAEKRFVMMTPNEGFRMIDSPDHNGKNNEQETFTGLDVSPKNEQRKVESAAPIPQKINVPERSSHGKKAIPRPAVADLMNSSVQMLYEEHDIYISYSISPTEFWIQLKADKDLIKKVDEALVHHMETAPLRVARPIVGHIYVMEHPTLGGHYRARLSALNGDTAVACFVDYGDVVPVSIEKIFSPPAGLELIHPLAACCRTKRRSWSPEAKERFISITSMSETVFRACFGSFIGKSVRVVESLFLHGKNIEEDIFRRVDKQESEFEATQVTKPARKRARKNSASEAFVRPAIADLHDPSHKVNTDGYDVYVSYVKSPMDFWIQLKADKELINQVLEILMPKLCKAKLPIVVDQLYAVEHPKIGGKFRARITSVNGPTAEACFVDYGDVHPVPIKNIFVLPKRLRLIPPMASRCRMERQEWPSLEKNKFILFTWDLSDVFQATFGAMDDDGVRRVNALFLGGRNIEDDIFPKLDSKENVEPARIESNQPAAHPVTSLPVILEVDEPVQNNDLVDDMASGTSMEVKKGSPLPAICDLYSSGTHQLEGFYVHISCVNSPSDLHVQMKADEDLINYINWELEHYIENGAVVVERPIVDQLYVMEHPSLGGFYRVRITLMDDDAVEACFVEYGDVYYVHTPRIYELPEHFKRLPFLAARCSMKRDKWTPGAKDRFVSIVSNTVTVFRAVFDSVEENGIFRIASLFHDNKNIEDIIFTKLTEDFLTPKSGQEKTDPVLHSSLKIVEPKFEEVIQSFQAVPELISDLEGFEPKVGEDGATRSLEKPEIEKEEMMNSKYHLGEKKEASTQIALSGSCDPSSHIETVASVRLAEASLTPLPSENGSRADPESPKRPMSTVQPVNCLEVPVMFLDEDKPVNSISDEFIAIGKSCAQEPSLDEEKPVDCLPKDDLIAFDDAHRSLLDVKATLLIDFITAPLEPVPQDPILAPVVQSLSYSAGIGSHVEEAQSVSIFVKEEPSESDSMSNPSILTATASIGSINEEQQAVSIIITDEPSIQSDLKPVTLAKEEQLKEMDAPDPVEVVAVEDVEQSDPDLDCNVQEVQPKSSVLTEMEVPSDCVATSEPIVHEEEEPVSDPAASDLIVYKGVDNKLATRAQLMQEITTSADGELNDPAQTLFLLHTDSAHVPEEDEEGNLKPQLVLEESKIDISELVKLFEIEEEVPSGREKEVADLVEEHPAPVQSVGAGTGDIRGEEVSDPVESSPLLLTLLHFAAVAIEVKLAESASSVAEKEHEKEPMAKDEEQPMESIFEIDTKMMDQSFNLHFPTPDQSVLGDSPNLEPFNLSILCNSEERKTELCIEDFEESDEELASTPDSEAAASESGN